MSNPANPARKSHLLSPTKTTIYILLAILQNFLAGGLFFGWASLSSTLFTSPNGCNLTPSQVSTIFSCGSFTNFMSPLLLGVLLDTSGPRITSFISLFIVALGLLGFSLSSSFVGFLTATLCISFGGPGVQNSLIHLGNVRPEKRSLLTSFITGGETSSGSSGSSGCGTRYLTLTHSLSSVTTTAFSLSFVVYAGFEKIWEAGYNYETIFGAYGLVIFGTSLLSLAVWPDTSYDSKGRLTKPVVKEKNHSFQPSKAPLNSYLRPNPKGQMSTHPSFVLSTVAFASGQLDNLNVKDQPFAYQVKSLSYFRIVLFFALLSYVANFGVGSVGLMLSDFKADNLSTLTTEFSVISGLGVLGMPIVGWLLDKQGEAFTAVVTSCLGICYCVLFLNEMFITSFWFYSMFRSFLFCYFFANLPVVMGFKYFGILAGIAFAASGGKS
ncbi:hypothetical protein TL16_g01221 [Triparma laevis f. inornata]|uniref:Uncharacterized protein n=1 Tax=Triparma laevis f. inornata TaxID=1714386 RepID=A0A9W7DS95_9STRA|nr:hypothetical protein TL16_g01221 [Triparma laevis f. inornata]